MNTLARISLGLLFLLASVVAAAPSSPTALDLYVAKPDPNYSYTVYHTESRPLYKTHFVRMVSQQWRSSAEVDRPIWQHDLMVTVPLFRSPRNRTAILIIDGGSNDGLPPRNTTKQAADLSVALGTVVAVVKQIPNEPLQFVGDTSPQRSEDAIIAYTFDKYLDPATRDEEWPLLLPMTKAVVRAMDTIQNGLATRAIRIQDFILFGASKRGWTAWLAAAVDPRVKAVLPASIDLLNLGAQNRHHCDVYGFFTDALEDYTAFDIPNRTNSPEGASLLAIVDPYAYRERLTMEKYILNSAGDQYFPSDSSQFYFAELPGPKLLRYTANTDHAQIGTYSSAVAWARRILGGRSTPRFSWSFDPDGTIHVNAQSRPHYVRLWQATNPRARDFRLESIGPAWTGSTLRDQGGGQYRANVAPPASGWTAYFIELTYRSTNPVEPSQVYSTEVRVTPDFLPYEGQICRGSH